MPEIRDNHVKDDLTRFYTLINDLLPFLHKNHKDEVVEKLLSENNLIHELLLHSNSIKPSEDGLKSASISLLSEIWSLEP